MTKITFIITQLILFPLVLIVNFSSIASELYEYTATIEVTPNKPNGKPWDFSGGAPDLFILVDNYSSIKTVCRNKYKCDIPFISRDTEWYFEIYDKDFSNHDLIGKGNCKVGNECVLDNAKITVNKTDS